MRDLEGSYFCFTDQGSKPRSRPGLAALASPRLVSSPEFPTEGLALLKSEQTLLRECQPKIGRGGSIIVNSIVAFTAISRVKSLMIKVLETFLAADTKENCKSLKPVSVHDRNEA